MEIDVTLFLLGLPLAFVLGWLASRFDIRQLRIDNRRSPKAYFRGLNHLLSDRQDEAIDAFIEAVQKDPDTADLHFALGNLFRRRGEYDRAVRVHEHLLARGDLKQTERDRAQHALSLDFLKAGLLDRAESALAKLDNTAYESQARVARLAIFERTRDWSQAAQLAHRIQSNPKQDAKQMPGGLQGDLSPRIAHYLCEQAAGLPSAEVSERRALLDQALAIAPQVARPRIDLAHHLKAQGDETAAFDMLASIAEHATAALPLVARDLVSWAQTIEPRASHTSQALALLQAHYEKSRSLDVLEAINTLQEPQLGREAVRAQYVTHLEHEPSLVVASRWLAGEQLEHEQFHPLVQKALDKAAQPLMRYRCAACGFEASRHFWQCPGCQAWDSYSARRVEEL
jgi:lipopolysaccharide assembly protein B